MDSFISKLFTQREINKKEMSKEELLALNGRTFDEQLEHLLILNPAVKQKKIPQGEDGNGRILTLKHGEQGIFKDYRTNRNPTPADQMRKIRAERAAYIVSLFLFNMVPTTVIRDYKSVIGSFQKWIPDAQALNTIASEQVPDLEKIKRAIFVYVINNIDTNGENTLIKSEKFHLVDNGDSFTHTHLADPLSLANGFNVPIPDTIIEELVRLSESAEKQEELAEALDVTIGTNSRRALFQRFFAITGIAERYRKIPSTAEVIEILARESTD